MLGLHGTQALSYENYSFFFLYPTITKLTTIIQVQVIKKEEDISTKWQILAFIFFFATRYMEERTKKPVQTPIEILGARKASPILATTYSEGEVDPILTQRRYAVIHVNHFMHQWTDDGQNNYFKHW